MTRSLLVILMPVFNDWESAAIVVQETAALLDRGEDLAFLLVNDGSTLRPPAAFERAVRDLPVSILHLRRNLGHQRAIAVGLAHVHLHMDADIVAVMDADGEDRPSDLPRLLARLRQTGESEVIFAERRRRSESYTFRMFYTLYRALHLALTGVRVRVGNFSVVPRSALDTLVYLPALLAHYAAGIFRSRLPYAWVPTSRGARLAGESRMNFVSLVAHGLNALSVFGDVIAVRIMIAMCPYVLISGTVFLARAAQANGVVSAPLLVSGVLFTVAMVVFAAAGALSLHLLGTRGQQGVTPLQDAALNIRGVEQVGEYAAGQVRRN
jgi:glycosyltransferase involved in cell wall biosynthesis